MKKIIVRLDDISWDMDIKKFHRARDILIKYNVHPLIGVIPNCKDEKLKAYAGNEYISKQTFWHEIKELHNQNGWSIALHGYDHVYTKEDGGILNINRRAEFAGLSLYEQRKRILRGKKILESNGLKISAFMAPAHSLDDNTVKVLIECSIPSVTDGIGIYPYYYKGMLFVPQLSYRLSTKGIGVDTVCFHVNEWDDNRFVELDNFLNRFAFMCVDYEDIIKRKEQYNPFEKISNAVVYRCYIFRQIAHRIKKKIEESFLCFL